MIFRNLINVTIFYAITGLSMNLKGNKVRSVHESSSPSYPELGFKSMKRQEVLMFLLDRISLSLITSSLLLVSSE